ncbi:OmpA family protein [Neolewinella agarilytica]|uniref:Outer membrane protein OmpA n=1 Tax=Neolewinella agarilytica TaxID=478744 RepID=A0A1H9J455_9BACT|nr:OmpA family protein [Neolewinella agarilytica]SEQ81567.1 Outer membrane protein OmpA [Neolewinella agarilytica]
MPAVSKVLFFLCWLVLAGHLSAQRGDDRAEATAAFDDGVQFLLAGKPRKAAKSFYSATRLDTAFIPARRLLGVAEELNGNLSEAAGAYQYVIERDSSYSRLIYYQLGKIYYRMSRPALALHYLLKFEELQERDLGEFGRNGESERPDELAALERLVNDIRAASITQDSSQFINVTKLFNLGSPVNSSRNEYLPFFSNDQSGLLFTRQGELGDEDLIKGRRGNLNDNFRISRFASVNSTPRKEGMATLVRDGERIFFTVCNDDEEEQFCKVYSGWLINGKIERAEKLPDYITGRTWVSQPAISCDGQQLYFASIRPGGVGGSDIYRCIKQEDGSWSEPKNLGTGVNTPLNEEAPFLSNDGRTLYFSSEGHQNLGDQDIFMSWWDEIEGRFTRAINLGPPVNGPHRELGFHLTSDGKTGYVASNRPGGYGGLDIYGFELSDRLSSQPITFVSGYVTDSLTGEPIPDQRVPVTEGKTYYTNYDGRFFICAPSESTLPLTITHPEYLPYERDFAIPTWANQKPYRIDLLLRREKVVEPPAAPPPPPPPPADTVKLKARVVNRNLTVRFNFDDASLTPTQLDNIEKFVASVKDKHIMRIVVTGFTDDVGDKAYNIRLSQKRAKAVGIHLQTAGIKANEVKIVGMGELSGAGQRALNRKVEVSVRYREMVDPD